MTKKILLMTICLMTLWCSFPASPSAAERDVKDSYLTSLFVPQFPYKSVKVVEDFGGNRFIVIKGKKKLNAKLMTEYNNLLISRGVNIYGRFHYGSFSWQKTLSDYAITITRKVSNEPDTIEVSRSVVRDPGTKEPVMAVSVRWNTVKIAIEKEFGNKWEKIKLIPDKEEKVKDPYIGRYPGSKYITKKLGFYYVYMTENTMSEVVKYYYNQLVGKYDKNKDDADTSFDIVKKEIIYNRLFATDITILSVKCMGKRKVLSGYKRTNNKLSGVEVIISNAIDPNLAKYVQIEISER